MANVYVRSLAIGTGTGADWANAYVTLSAALTAKAAGDDFWVAADHSETTVAAIALTSPGTAAAPCRVICAIHTGTVPPVSADLATTAIVQSTLANSITFAGHAYYYGMNIKAGSVANAATIAFSSTTTYRHIFESCTFELSNTASTSVFQLGANSGSPTFNEFINSTFRFGAIGQSLSLYNGEVLWRDTASGVVAAGTIPTNLITSNSNSRAMVLCMVEGVDLSALGTGKNLVGALIQSQKVLIKDCKIDPLVTRGTTPTGQASSIDIYRVAGVANNYRHERYRYEGTQAVSITVKRTSGASINSTGLSWKIDTTANSKWQAPFRAQTIVAPNSTTGSAVTVTLEGLADPRGFSALPNNDEFWFNVEYLGDASSGLGSKKTSTKADALATGTALTASTQAWDTGATARANSTAYALGDVFKLATNPGRIFICTTAGTTAASEPGGYAVAVDSDAAAVADGTAAFKAGWRFKQTVTLSSPFPGQVGTIYIYPRMAKASSTIYLDPYPVMA